MIQHTGEEERDRVESEGACGMERDVGDPPPSNRRAWAQRPVHIGDCVAPTDIQRAHPRNVLWITGVLPRGLVEVVSMDQIDRAPGAFGSTDDIHEALRDGRLLAYGMPRHELAPVTRGMFEAAVEVLGDE